MSNTTFHGNIALSSFGTITGTRTGVIYAFTNTQSKGDDQLTAYQIETKIKANSSIVAWGSNNDYPQKIYEQIKKNGTGSASLRFLRKAHYGNGLNFLRRDVTPEGKHNIQVVPLNAPGMEATKEFWSRNQMPRFWKETILDLEWWNIAFPEYVLSLDYSTINRVKRQKTAWCRFEVMNTDNGLVENVYVSEKFGKESVTLDSPYVAKIPLIDSYWSAEEVREYCKANKIHNFVRPIFYPMLDEAYYPVAEWHTAVESGWLEVANAVPAWNMNMFRNQISVLLHVEIDERYFQQRYLEKWFEWNDAERQAKRMETTDAINEHLSKPENAGKSIMTMMFVDGKDQQTSAVKVTPIDNKLKDGAYLPQAEAANSETAFALGVDPSLIGAGIPGGKLGAGSGSDKTAAFNIVSALFKTNRETTVEVVDFIRDYNGWDPTLSADFENTILTTLDKNPTGTQKTTS